MREALKQTFKKGIISYFVFFGHNSVPSSRISTKIGGHASRQPPAPL